MFKEIIRKEIILRHHIKESQKVNKNRSDKKKKKKFLVIDVSGGEIDRIEYLTCYKLSCDFTSMRRSDIWAKL